MNVLKYFFAFLIPVSSYSQISDIGIHFEKDLTWQQVKAKAAAENKYIFLDCYTTWCGPCKHMDRKIYPIAQIGDLMNDQFICIKVQMDSTNNDNSITKKWYNDAKTLAADYTVNAYPTFLFFTPEGKAIDKGIGAKDSGAFVQMVRQSLNRTEQYYILLNQYKSGNLSLGAFPVLAKKAKELNEKKISLEIAKDYMHNCLDRLPEAQFCNKENLDFIRTYSTMLTSRDRFFEYCLHSPLVIDTVLGNGVSSSIIKSVIYREEIMSAFDDANTNGKDINWNSLRKKITAQYGDIYSKQSLLQGQLNWYRSKKEWKQYAHYLVDLVDAEALKTKPGMNALFFLNNNAYAVFRYSSDKRELEHAIAWIDLALPLAPTYASGMLDTKANLLYKLGRVQEAITLETKVVNMEPSSKEFQEVLQKMKDGKPTWDSL